MMNRLRTGIVLVMLAGLVGCTGSSSPTPPTAPSPAPNPPPSPSPPGSWVYAPGYVLVEASLSGIVFEVTPTGQVPVPGVSVYCDACSEVGHTWQTTDAAGFYKFSGDIAHGGGIWLTSSTSPCCPANTAYLIVGKEGYADPPGGRPGPVYQGWRDVTVKGDTRFDIQLVRR